jgi:hypothetical protein
VDNVRKWKDILYTAFVASGSCLPPVIFTADVKLSTFHIDDAFIYVQPNIKGHGNKSTLKWFETVKDYFDQDWLLLTDNGGGSHSQDFVEEAKEFGCQIIYYNTYGGKLLSVNDNPFHATIRRHFLKLPHKTHEESIRSIVKAYRSPNDESVRVAFERVGITSKTPSAKVVRTLYSEGFRLPKNEEKKFSQMLNKYRQHKLSMASNSGFSSRKLRPRNQKL